MKQKTIIQVWGSQEKGKTGTIKILREELTIRYLNPSYTYSLPLPPGEVSDILVCNGLKVGIESMGDFLNAWGLRHKLDDYVVKHNCDVIICASRVYNDVAKHIEYLAKTYNYRLLKVTNYRGDALQFKQDELNRLSAKHFSELVDQIVTGII